MTWIADLTKWKGVLPLTNEQRQRVQGLLFTLLAIDGTVTTLGVWPLNEKRGMHHVRWTEIVQGETVMRDIWLSPDEVERALGTEHGWKFEGF